MIGQPYEHFSNGLQYATHAVLPADRYRSGPKRVRSIIRLSRHHPGKRVRAVHAGFG
jgi:hypothetical protein